MTEEQRHKAAKEYVDKQLRTMEEDNAAPEVLSEAEYKGLIDEVAEVIRS